MFRGPERRESIKEMFWKVQFILGEQYAKQLSVYNFLSLLSSKPRSAHILKIFSFLYDQLIYASTCLSI